MLGLGLGLPYRAVGGGAGGAGIVLSANTIAEGVAPITVGTLSVFGATGSPTFSIAADPSNKFALSGGTTLVTDQTVDYETTPTLSVTISVSGTTPAISDAIFTIYVTNVVEDSTPGAFSFTDITDAAYLTVYTSNSITVTSTDDPALVVTVTGGTYSKNGGAYTSSPGTAALGDTFTVRGTSPAADDLVTDVVLTIGGVSDTFSIATPSTVETPDAPVLTWTSDETETNPVFSLVLDDAVDGDTVQFEVADENTFTPADDSADDELDAAEILAGQLTPALDALTDGEWFVRCRHKHVGGSYSDWSNTVSETIVTVETPDAPVLTWVSGVEDSTPLLGVALDGALEGDTVRIRVYTDAGLTSLFDEVEDVLDGAEIGTGQLTPALDDLEDATQYWIIAHHKHAGGSYSAASNTETKTMAFITATYTFDDSIVATPSSGSYSVSLDIGAASASRVVVIGAAAYGNSDTDITAVTINGVSATEIISRTPGAGDMADGGQHVSLWAAEVPTGSGAQTVVFSQGGTYSVEASIFSGHFEGVSITPVATGKKAWSATGFSQAMTDFGITVLAHQVNITPNWTNATGNDETVNGAGFSTQMANSSGSVTVSHNSAGQHNCGVWATFEAV